MRLSTAEFTQSSINSILDQQSQLNQTQQQLSTGRSIVTPADNPPGAAQALQLQSAIDTNTQWVKNGDAATASLNLEQSTLTQVKNVLQSVRTLVIQANNGTENNQSRAAIATQVKQNLQEVLGYANTRDSNGNYIFAGSQTATKPFTQNPGGSFAYSGDQIQRFIQIGGSRQIASNDPGSSVFMQIPAGNGRFVATAGSSNQGTGIIDPGSVTQTGAYTGDTYQIKFTGPNTFDVTDTTTNTPVLSNQTYQSGSTISFAGIQTNITGAPKANDTFTIDPSASQSVFKTLQNIVTTLNTPVSNNASKTAMHNQINQELSSLDQGINNVINTQASVGSRQNAITSQQSLQQDWGVQLQTAQSKIQNLDYAKAISLYQQQLTALKAAEQTYTKVQGLSLFNYL
ncbi:flagellar hook-associated protein FlgL [Acidihalobacter ferrooxydans]|uniref:Flagellar hook-associated protein 3 n=1 Tax=Acidihalobacter ferrooxydans TaxID=1765967 RepID=A0A1P8UGU3_9GAMM|nr:flagellar hook-associated protein FlgL [Acidihalobacter ferrooxydans]APZ42994.1 flagellar hook-associated protein 3 [Acidihalobacter ferrooxydans]